MKNLKKLALAAAAYSLPFVAFAGGAGETADSLVDLFNKINALINAFIPFLVGIAVLIIIWGVFNYIAGAGDEEKRAQAKSFIVWGVVGVFIMLSIWGLVSILVNSIELRRGPLDDEDLPFFDTELEFVDPGGGAGGGGGGGFGGGGI